MYCFKTMKNKKNVILYKYLIGKCKYLRVMKNDGKWLLTNIGLSLNLRLK